MNLLYITSWMTTTSTMNGRVQGVNRNYMHIKSIVGDEKCFLYELPGENVPLFTRLNKYAQRRLDCMTKFHEKKIISVLKEKKISIVYMDSSVLGFLTEKIARQFPDIRIIIFAHDIDQYRFATLLDEIKGFSLKNIKSKFKWRYGLYLAKLNESKTFKYAHYIICLNSRDNELLEKYYRRKADTLIPVTFPDKESIFNCSNDSVYSSNGFNLVSISANYQPNVEGLRFFIENVINRVQAHLYVVGYKMEEHKEEFENLSSKVTVIGTVDDLSPHYIQANAVICPVYSGGGMKTKTCEALMYGKTIFGTTEAFTGYDVDYGKVGGLCNTAEEFIAAISDKSDAGCKEKFNEYSRSIFLEKYSHNYSERLFLDLFEKIEKSLLLQGT